MKINVAVIFGGKSTEHEVAIISAIQAIENINKDKYNIIPIYINKDGDFYYNKEGLFNEMKNFKDIKTLLKKSQKVFFVKDGNKTFVRNVNNKVFNKNLNELIDVAFPIVHGTNVEDGNLQGYLHTLNLPIVGPDCLSASVCMDKFVMKEYCKSLSIPVIDAIRIDKNDYKNFNNVLGLVNEKIKYPVIVKPTNLGSSIGIKKAKNDDELKDALELAFSFANIVLIEKAINNLREINCAVLGDKFDSICSALEEPFGNDEILSFADKYLSGSKNSKSKNNFSVKNNKLSSDFSYSKGGMASLKRKIPADIDKQSEEKIKDFAKKIFKYIGCSGVARIDFIIDNDNGNIYANEINAIPGSLSYYLFEPIGIKYSDLIEKLIDIAIKNKREQDNLQFVFDSNLF